MSNIWNYILCMGIIPYLLMGLLGLLLGWLLFRGRRTVGDLSVEGEGALRAEADGYRARIQELEGQVASRDGEVSDLKGKLAAGAAGAAGAAALAGGSGGGDDDESYALEWRNRYLAARVKYLEGRLADGGTATAKKKAAPKKKVSAKTTAAPKEKAPAKKASAKKSPAKKAAPKKKPAAKAKAKPKVLYTDGPTDGKPDDLKMIKGIGPKFEKDLNSKGIYYFRQIANWKAADVKMVEGVIDSIPGRIKRDEWVKQAKGMKPSATATKPKAAKKKAAPKKAASAKAKAKAKSSDADARLDKYYANVKKFDGRASKTTVAAIVKYCGPALRSRDSSLVACSDEAELSRVAKGFATKKLGLKSGQMDLVKDVCQQMKGERFKNRVTFYYLAAKKAGKLGIFK